MALNPLIAAVLQNNLEEVKQLLSQDLPIVNELTSARDIEGRTAVHHASMRGALELLVPLLDAGADVKCVDESGATALMLSAGEGRAEAARALLNYGAISRAHLDAADKAGLRALDYACVRGSPECVRVLREAGARPDREDCAGETALMRACKAARADSVRALLEWDRSLRSSRRKRGSDRGGGRGGVREEKKEVEKEVEKEGECHCALAGQVNDAGLTALLCACVRGSLACVTLLLAEEEAEEEGEKEEVKEGEKEGEEEGRFVSAYGKTALMLACQRRNNFNNNNNDNDNNNGEVDVEDVERAGVVRALMGAGARWRARWRGRTALCFSAGEGLLLTSAALLERERAELARERERGREREREGGSGESEDRLCLGSPLLAAAAAGHTHVVSLLIDFSLEPPHLSSLSSGSSGRLVDFRDENGRDCLMLACRTAVSRPIQGNNNNNNVNNVNNGEPGSGCVSDRDSVVRALLMRGADPNCTSAEGESALFNCVSGDCPSLVRMLLEAGADSSIPPPATLRTSELRHLADFTQNKEIKHMLESINHFNQFTLK